MLKLLTTDEFAAWYTTLPDRDAEEVATALEVIERLGPERAAPDSTEWVLWYENAAFSRWTSQIDEIVNFGAAARQMLAQLESPRFRKRLLTATTSQTHVVYDALEALRVAARLRRRGLVTTPAGPGLSAELGLDALQQRYAAALAAVGVEIGDARAHSAAVRELTLRECTPRIRLLYGVDTSRGVALVLLGERLDREHYGASVRRAETAWREFLAGDHAGLTQMPPR